MIRLLTLHNFPDVELHVQVWIFTVVAQLDQGDRHHEPPPHTSTRHVSNVWPCCAIVMLVSLNPYLCLYVLVGSFYKEKALKALIMGVFSESWPILSCIVKHRLQVCLQHPSSDLHFLQDELGCKGNQEGFVSNIHLSILFWSCLRRLFLFILILHMLYFLVNWILWEDAAGIFHDDGRMLEEGLSFHFFICYIFTSFSEIDRKFKLIDPSSLHFSIITLEIFQKYKPC